MTSHWWAFAPRNGRVPSASDETSMTRLTALRIDDATWDRAEGKRRDEWRLAIAELLGDPEQAFVSGAHTLLITVSGQSTFFELRDDQNASLARVEVPRSELTEHVTEYVDIVRQIARADEGLGSARVEALDMAKRPGPRQRREHAAATPRSAVPQSRNLSTTMDARSLPPSRHHPAHRRTRSSPGALTAGSQRSAVSRTVQPRRTRSRGESRSRFGRWADRRPP